MEPSLLPPLPVAVPALRSSCRLRLQQELRERSHNKDFFETQVDGGFQCLTFTNALILSALAYEAPLHDIREQLCQRLLQEFGPYGTVNYWMRSVASAPTSPYPDDLDDTFCTLSAVYLHEPKYLGGEHLAQATVALTNLETETGGPYRSWVVPATADLVWKDVDLAVNANVAYFLKLNGIRLPKLDAYLAHHLSLPASAYYPGPLNVLYFLARALEGTSHARQLQDMLLSCTPGNILEKALLISSLLRSGAVLQAQALEASFLSDLEAGQGFAALPFCIDNIVGDVKHFAACPEITAALCLEALHLLDVCQQLPAPEMTQLDPSLAIIAATKARLDVGQDPALQTLTDSFLTKLTNITEIRELASLPLDFAQAWNTQTQSLPIDVLEKLCSAHLLGWVAYTLYDDIIDQDGSLPLLSVANLAHRELLNIFAGLPLDHSYRVWFKTILNGMDVANAWELLHTRLPLERLPDYGPADTLYARSGGIMLSPVAVLRLAGYEQGSPEVSNVITFFQHYLAAKQLNDDAHDWQEDLGHGHVTAVVAKLLNKHGLLYSPNDLQKLQRFFWDDVIVTTCKDISDHIAAARAALEQLPDLARPEFFTNLINPLAASAQKALAEREQSLAFLATLAQSSPNT